MITKIKEKIENYWHR